MVYPLFMPRPCQLLLLDGLRGRRRAEVSLSSLCVQVLPSVWTEAAEVMPAVVAGWLDGYHPHRADLRRDQEASPMDEPRLGLG